MDWQIPHSDNFGFEFHFESLGLVVNVHGPTFSSFLYLQKELFVEERGIQILIVGLDYTLNKNSITTDG